MPRSGRGGQARRGLGAARRPADGAPGAGRRAGGLGRCGHAGRPAAGGHRPVGRRAAADAVRRRPLLDRLQRGDLQLRRAGPAAARARRGAARRGPTPRCCSRPTPPRAGTRCAGCAACSPSPSGTPQTGELFCARDPFGVKPLYYTLAEGGSQFRFASERKALLGPGEVSALDPDALRRYLSFQYVPAPATMTPPVSCLPAVQLPGGAAGRAAGAAVAVLAADAARRPGRPPPRPRSACWPRCAARSRPTCAATCRRARSCPAAWTRPRSAPSPPRPARACRPSPPGSPGPATARSSRRRRRRRRWGCGTSRT